MPVDRLLTHDEHKSLEPPSVDFRSIRELVGRGQADLPRVTCRLGESNRPQSIPEKQKTEQLEEVTKDLGMPLHDAMPFYVPSVHAWHVQFTDRAEEHMILIKSSIPVDTLLHAIQADHLNRPFVMRPLQIADLRLAPSPVTPPSSEIRLIRSGGYVIPNDPQH